MAQLLVQRDVIEPAVTKYLQRRIAAAQASPRRVLTGAEQVGTLIFGLQNSRKFMWAGLKHWRTRA